MKTARTWKATVIRTSGTKEERTVDLRDLASLRNLIGGTVDPALSIEVVYCKEGILYVDGDGRRKDLPFNREASRYYAGWPPNPIVGTALLVSRKDFADADRNWER